MDPITRSSLLIRHSDQDRLRREGVSKEIYTEIYRSAAPWEIDQPQPEIIRLELEGKIVGTVLDVGCGTGENVLFLAERGYKTLGIDFVEAVVEQAREKAARRHVAARFAVHDVFDVTSLGMCFDTVIDSATFHAFSDPERVRYSQVVHATMKPGAVLHLICIADRESYTGGPRHISQEEIRATFAQGWEVVAIREARYLATLFPDGARAWCTELRRC
jgi:cyclopropane fatty-acyl-phospholipid synthase-like methyltransferase